MTSPSSVLLLPYPTASLEERAGKTHNKGSENTPLELFFFRIGQL
jgi:hypothetical protein